MRAGIGERRQLGIESGEKEKTWQVHVLQKCHVSHVKVRAKAEEGRCLKEDSRGG